MRRGTLEIYYDILSIINATSYSLKPKPFTRISLEAKVNDHLFKEVLARLESLQLVYEQLHENEKKSRLHLTLLGREILGYLDKAMAILRMKE